MNEGKPTKSARTKWWTRPRPVPPEEDEAVSVVPVAGTAAAVPEGDHEPERPRTTPGSPRTDPAAPDPARTPPRQAPAPAETRDEPLEDGLTTGPEDGTKGDSVSGSAARSQDGTEGDVASGLEGGTKGGSATRSAGDAGGDFELAKPLPAAGGDFSMPTAHQGEAPAAVPAAASGEAPVGSGGRAEPLHEPDPYGTPPYGEPGPWAPAPPVQHPAVASAPDTAGPAPAAVASATPSAPVPGPAAPGDGAGPWQRYDPWAARPLPAPLLHSGAPARRSRLRRTIIGGALALALVSGGLGGLLGAYIERNGGVGAVQLPQAGKEPAGRAPDSVAGIAARALPSVVTLHVTGADEQGTGTGFVLDRLGHILTNNHVVENAASGGDISVTFSGGQTAKARIIGRDTGYDLAVVQVRGVRGLTPIPLGNSDNVQVGDPVVAIGAPFDLANTVTSGIISAKERPITAGGQKGDGSDVSYVDALQTDAPINPGNSGGPLLDTKGRVVGINSAIRSADTGSDLQTGQAGSIGLGFAIPVNQARRVAEELINKGKASHPVIGVTLDMNYTGDGAKVGAKGRDGGAPVTPGGPGARAGIKAGDVITAVDGQRVHSGEELIVKTRAHRPGDRLELTVRRDGTERSVSLVLGSSSSG
ncbi:S1C family serine protease [Streptomyces anandii]|uniref:S1C family serine protease n=1 Tax=Streptomyces anandii TaxID=285454 RepID=UPI00167AFA08|nr:trypsin-like peptidase domain-containing protein [Streptomyces anandii]